MARKDLLILAGMLAFVGLALLGLFLLGIGQVNAAPRIFQYQIKTNEKTDFVTSTEDIPANLLAQAGVRLFPGDQVLVDGFDVPAGQPVSELSTTHSLEYRPAILITVKDGKRSLQAYTRAATVAQALWDIGIPLYEADQLSPEAGARLTGPLEITLQRARKYTVNDFRGQTSIRSSASTVGQALAGAGMPLQGMDYSQPSENEPLPDDRQITIKRVSEEIILEQKVLAYQTEYQTSPDLAIDAHQVIQPGIFGLKVSRLRVRYEDGKEVSRLTDAEWIASQPQNEIVAYGSKIVVKSIDTPYGTLQYWHAMQIYATSYSPCRSGGDHCWPNTASGKPVQKGVVAMLVSWYRQLKGTQVYIPGYGIGTVLDTGGGIPDRDWIDLGYSDSDYVSWHDWVTVYFLAPPPAEMPSVLQ